MHSDWWHRFNHQAMKALSDDIQERGGLFIPLCMGAERRCCTAFWHFERNGKQVALDVLREGTGE